MHNSDSDAPTNPPDGSLHHPVADGDSRALPPASRRRWFRKKRYYLLAFVLLFGAAELALRILGGRDSVYMIRMGAELEWDPVRHFKLRKNFHSGDIHLNSKGFMGPEFNAGKDPGSYRIVTLGDSASVMPASHNYPRQLEVCLRRMIPHKKIDVINASCPGYDSRTARSWYETEVDGYEHDMFIIYIGWNDMGQFNPDGLAYKLNETGYLKEPNLFQQMILNCYVLRSVYVIQGHWERRGNLSFTPLDADEAKRYADFYPIHFEKNLRALVDLAKSRNRKVFLLNYASILNEAPTPEEQRRIHFPRGMGKKLAKYLALKMSYEAALHKVASETGTPIIDIESIFRDPESRKVFSDAMHFEAEGADRIADRVATEVAPLIK